MASRPSRDSPGQYLRIRIVGMSYILIVREIDDRNERCGKIIICCDPRSLNSRYRAKRDTLATVCSTEKCCLSKRSQSVRPVCALQPTFQCARTYNRGFWSG